MCLAVEALVLEHRLPQLSQPHLHAALGIGVALHVAVERGYPQGAAGLAFTSTAAR